MLKNRTIRLLLIVGGAISLLLGIIGIFLPLLPTTPFVLLAAYCFAKSSKKLHDLMLRQKLFGKIILDYEQNKIIKRKTKVVALLTMWLSLLLSITFFMPFYWVKAVVIAIGISVSIYLLKFPSDNNGKI